MIDSTRTHILELYNFFQDHPGAIVPWIKSSRFRYNQLSKKEISRGSLTHARTAARLLYSLFLEQIGKGSSTFENLPALLSDLKTSKMTAFFCEITYGNAAHHYFVIQKTAKNTFYLYQSHPPYYTLYDSLHTLDVRPLTYAELNIYFIHLSQATTSAYCSCFFKNLFHLDAPSRTNREASFSYHKCEYVSFEPFMPPQRVVTYRYTMLKASFLLSAILVIFVVTRLFKS